MIKRGEVVVNKINIDDVIGHLGQYNIKVIQDGEVVEEVDFTNLITNAYLDELAKIPQGIAPDFELKYIAIGTGSTAPSVTDTQLETEIFRKQVTSQSKTGTGKVTTIFVIIDSEAVATWGEIGIFVGSTATGTVNSGVLASRVLYSRSKTSLEEIQITRKDIFGRA